MIVFGFKKHEIFFETIKFFDFFRKYMGKMVEAGAEIFDKLEPGPEPKFFTSWSRSRTKMVWLRNTAGNFILNKLCVIKSVFDSFTKREPT
jgi:hypothetical protein